MAESANSASNGGPGPSRFSAVEATVDGGVGDETDEVVAEDDAEDVTGDDAAEKE